MSELIDSVVDVAKIKTQFDAIKNYVDELKTTIAGFSSEVNKEIGNVRAAKNQDDLTKSSKVLNDTMVKSKQTLSEYEKQQKQLQVVQEKLNVVNSDANKAIIAKNLKMQEARALSKAQAVLNDKEAGTLEKLTAQNKILAIEKKKLNIETAEGKKRLDEIIAAENENNKALKIGNNEEQKRIVGIGQYKKQIGELVDGFKNGEIGTKQLASGFAKLGKQMIISFVTNPIFLALTAVVLLIKGVASAIKDSEERSNKLSEGLARLKPILRTIGDAFEVVADAVIKTVGFLGKAVATVTEFLGINPKGSADQFVQAEKSKQKAISETRKLNEDASNQEAIIAEQREIISNKEDYTYKQRVEALKKAGEAEKQLSLDRQRIAELNLKALEEEAALDDNNAEMNDKLSAAIVAVNAARIESANIGRKLAKEQQKLTKENEADLKAEADARKAAAKEREEAAKETARKLIEANRMLIDSQLNLMTDGEAKQIAILNEGFKRKLEDLQANGQLTNELEKNLTAANAIELQKIRDDFAKKRVDEEKKAQDERNMLIDKQIADFEANIQKEVELLSAGYREKETELKRQYAAGKIDKQKYESDLLSIQSEALKEANDLTIKNLQKELEIANISTDKRAEISAKIRDLQIDNENAVLDATIEANQKKVDSDKEAFGKRLQIAEQLTAAGMELFQAIGDFEAQQSENRLAEFEKQQAANDDYFAKRQENLDNAIMSDASREAAQKAIDEEKAKRDKAILDKKREEEIKQAKWEKAQSLVSAIINTAMAVVKAIASSTPPLNFVFAALAGAAGAAQIATITSQQIPAFEKGGITGDGLALWGEARPEVALTKTGDVMFTERPTVSKFDAGTRIFKSVEDFEKNMISTGNKSFEFDYQKMAELMPRNSIELNGNGSWTVIDKENNRRSMINRRIKLN